MTYMIASPAVLDCRGMACAAAMIAPRCRSHAHLRRRAACRPLYKEVKRRMTEALDAAASGSRARPSRRAPARPSASAYRIGTVRKAIDELVAEDILIRQQGRGTFVASHNRDRMLFYFFHIVGEDGRASGIPTSSCSRSRRRRPTAARPSTLGDRRGEPCSASATPALAGNAGHRRRHHAAGGRSSRASRSAVPRPPVDDLQPVPGRFGISVLRTNERLRATLADAETAALLGVARGAPLLAIRRVALTYHDVPVELRVSRVNTAQHEYFADIG